jgi:magnesium-transporting ATPase (P-type)
VFAAKFGIDYQSARERNAEINSIPYESEHAYSASINHYDGETYLFVKGSVEKVLSMCSHSCNPEHIEQQSSQLAKDGYRVLGLACKKLEQVPANPEEILNDCLFLGIAGMIDPLRPEVIQAVQQCKDADIIVAIITGDHPQTATALAFQAGIADKAMLPVTDKQITEAVAKGKTAFSECIQSTKVFARISPHQKKLIVQQIIEHGEFVAVTGDGANDAPALSHAHIGIAMGLRGTDVARESSDLILTDDNFSSIVQGVKQGRIVYNNIRKVIFLLISTGAAEIMLVILSLLFGTPLPLLPIQLLWLNLVTNGIQDVALAFEPEEGQELNKPPRSPDEPIFNRLMIERIIVNAIVMGSLAFVVFTLQLAQGVSEESARNITLLLMVLFENVHVLNSRSETCSIFRQNFFGNKILLFGMLGAQAIHVAAMYTPGICDILQLEPVTLYQWTTLLSIALTLVIVDESHKQIHKWRE